MGLEFRDAGIEARFKT